MGRLTEEIIKKLKTKELKLELSKRGLATKGKKDDLVTRLLKAIEEGGHEEEDVLPTTGEEKESMEDSLLDTSVDEAGCEESIMNNSVVNTSVDETGGEESIMEDSLVDTSVDETGEEEEESIMEDCGESAVDTSVDDIVASEEPDLSILTSVDEVEELEEIQGSSCDIDTEETNELSQYQNSVAGGNSLFVNVCMQEGDDNTTQLPVESDGTLLMSVVKEQFPNAIGLKYRSTTGRWRGVRTHEAGAVLHPPHGGWGDQVFIVTESAVLKRKAEKPKPKHKESKTFKFLEDLIVLGLSYETTEDELKQYFTDNCGELHTCQLKTNRETGKSRGFGFIRFVNPQAAEAAMKGTHEIQGRRLVIRLAQRKGDTPTKLFVGRLPVTVTYEEVNEYFSNFGMVVDCFLPNPFRGFAFVTFADQDDAKTVLRMSHSIQGAHLNVSAAESKSERIQQTKERQQHQPVYSPSPTSSYGKGTHDSLRMGTGYGSRATQESQSQQQQQDVVSNLKDMLQTWINNRR